ncbi:HAD superfamily phosphatase (TIGR01668 family) [Breznakia sp. PF5-3]|uniref:YqeG family HAD IIIA-type phosphatase n=1 Tax=unclassified Breznakia TaxID=2623764 RepID=UPI002406CAE7|nr:MULTISPECIES: YqeG family HAD IIIA-type phosphatase [unclassified Breznakia]MDF9824075.1 HAD superfamily phosphatase (TIGR01668 family) [Breznakia sp. PM6-1]MDF9834859.1 HAD superfamily phosphatase (TIGR01668 family) [Breznakia sp. PF5-3]MDF9837119.1 HAD superfamily phosphatase (TIGR01668 family) [Breznakia sp. PFB2-8]MDF9859044.1 HAD superfamily phosphatase (TIGR01668 family) [Breznakia sp. PH5-24]
MIRLFTPDLYVKSFMDIDIQKLVKMNKKLIICDIDNTLVAHDMSLPSDKAKQFVENVLASGLQICLISNNHKERVETFAKALGIHRYSFAKKPIKWTYRKILKDYAMKAEDVVAIGDQLLTDVLGAKRMKIYAILTSPLVDRDLNSTKINRKIERRIYKRLENRGILKRGVFNE